MTSQNNKPNLPTSQSGGGRATLRDVIAKPNVKIRAGLGVESRKELVKI